MKSSLPISHENMEQISNVLETFHLHHQGFITSFHVYITDGPRRFHCAHRESFRCNVKGYIDSEYLMIGCLVHKLEQEFLQYLTPTL
jgi:hypothetical protein